MSNLLTKLQTRIDSGIPAIADLHMLRDAVAEIERLRVVIESAYDAQSHETAMGILHNAMEGR